MFLNRSIITAEQKESIRSQVRARIQQQMRSDYRVFRNDWLEEIKANFISCCRHICIQQAAGTKEAVHYILYSLLRTGLIDDQPAYLIQATDENNVFDRDPLEYEYDGNCLYRYWKLLLEELAAEASSSGWQISVVEMEHIRLEEANYFHHAIIPLLRKAIRQAVQLPEYMEMNRSEQLEIRAGEYLDQSILIYKEDCTDPDAAEIHRWLSEKNSYTYGYQHIHDITLSMNDYKEMDFRYTTFQNIQVELCRMDFSILAGTQWRECKLEKSALPFSLLHGADFSGCTLQYVLLDGVMGSAGIEELDWEPLGYDGVNFTQTQISHCWLRESKLQEACFQYSQLDQVDFSKAGLRQVDFRESRLTNIIFQDADLRNACFDHCNLDNVSFAGANLQGASFNGTKLKNIDFTDAVLSVEQLDAQQRHNAYGIDVAGGRLQ
ncbi:pentapeptide repeat-containing protein [Paenibacillus shenyangensis]|uniref:pentapeptide repeat-containing protein n=1 Tax=Paenibacillus sp. A9 TaxID=1284352 RepID=UPI000370D545|nr:pentapeptide repeat-containing protein [Paenibacillus sp. A9]